MNLVKDLFARIELLGLKPVKVFERAGVSIRLIWRWKSKQPVPWVRWHELLTINNVPVPKPGKKTIDSLGKNYEAKLSEAGYQWMQIRMWEQCDPKSVEHYKKVFHTLIDLENERANELSRGAVENA